MPKLICPKGELSYVGCFQTDFRFSLPREICHQKFKNDGHKCDFVGGNVLKSGFASSSTNGTCGIALQPSYPVVQ